MNDWTSENQLHLLLVNCAASDARKWRQDLQPRQILHNTCSVARHSARHLSDLIEGVGCYRTNDVSLLAFHPPAAKSMPTFQCQLTWEKQLTFHMKRKAGKSRVK